MTLLSLEQFRKIIGYHPWHFWGLGGSSFPITSACNTAVFKYAWQSTNAAGREDILEAIENAESMMTREMGFSPAPHWKEEILNIPRYYNPGLWNMSPAQQAGGNWRELRASEGYLREFGKETLTLLGTENVVLSDPDGDGVNEVFTVSFATALTDTDEIEAYFAAANRIDSEAVSSKYRIHPLTITISAGTCTIKGKTWQIVKPVSYETSSSALDATDANNFVTTLEIYRHYTDVAGQAITDCHALLIWETDPYPMWACGSTTLNFNSAEADPAALAYGIARAGIRHDREGILYFGRAIYNTNTSQWEQASWGACYPPARAQVRYQAGFPLENGEMRRDFQKAVARLAMAELEERICACDQANRELYRWQFDTSTTRGPAGESYTPTANFSNPFGTRRGHLYAWDFVKSWRMVPAVTF